MKRRRKQRKKRAVVAPSAPWDILNDDKELVGRADTNGRRQKRAVELCRELDAELLIVSGRVEEMDLLELVALEARREARFRPERTLLQSGAYNTFLNGYFSLEIAWRLGIEEVFIASNRFHEERLMTVFGGILEQTARRLGWTIPVQVVACPPSSLPEMVAFEARLAAQEAEKCGWERATLAGYVRELHGWHHRRDEFLPFPKIVREKVPPAARSLARLASERRALE